MRQIAVGPKGKIKGKLTVGVTALVIAAGSVSCTRDAGDEAGPVQIAPVVGTFGGGGKQPITPTSAQVPVDAQQAFQTNLGAGAVWSVGNPAIASVSADGVVTGLKAGTTTVGVTNGAKSASATLTVTSAKLKAISVTEAKRVRGIPQGDVPFAATGVFDVGPKAPLSDSAIVWATSDAAIATISPDGLLTPLAPGHVLVTATDIATGIVGSVSFTVAGSPITGVEVSPRTLSVPVGFEGTFKSVVLQGRMVDKHPDTVVWSVSDSTIASITNAGVVTALKVGQATIWATERSSGVTGSATLAVISDQSVEVQVTCLTKTRGGACSIPADATLTVKAAATGITDRGRRAPLTWTPVWTSSDQTIATVSSTQQPTCTPLQLKGRSTGCSQVENGEVVGLSPGQVTITATDPVSGLSDSVVVTVDKPLPLQAIVVAPVSAGTSGKKKSAAISLPVGADQAYSATALYGSTKGLKGLKGVARAALTVDVTDRAVWTTTKATIATVSNAHDSEGVVTGVAKGSVTVQAEFGGQSGSAKLTVVALPLKSIEVSPQTSSVPAGEGEQLTATGIYTSTSPGGKATLVKFDITGNVTWSSSNASATVSNAPGREGSTAAQQPGTAVITATDVDSGKTGTAWITVTPAALTGLAISPASSQMAPGDTSRFHSEGTFSDGRHVDMSAKVTWTTTAKAVASVSNLAATVGLVTAKSLGHTDIGAFDPATGVTAASVPVDVVALRLTSLTVSPAAASIPDGLTQQFTASGTYNTGLTRDLTNVVIWSVAPGSAAISNAAGSAGLASSQGAGTSSIQALEPASGLQATATLTVTPAQLVSIAVTPAAVVVAPGLTQQFTATGNYTDGSTQDLTAVVVWDSSAPDLFSVDNAAGSEGLGTALAEGQATVSAVDPTTGITATASVGVALGELLSLAISPAQASLPEFTPQQFTAIGTFADGSTKDMTSIVTWSSSMPEVFTFATDPATNGLGTSGNAGVSIITAVDPLTSAQASTPVTVGATFSVTLTLTPPQECCFGCGEPYTIIVTDMDTDGNVIDTVSVASTDVATAGSVTVTLPTQLPTGFAYTIDVETDSEVYTCAVGVENSTETSGVISGPVSITPNCFRNNC